MPSSKAPTLFIAAIWALVAAVAFALLCLPLLQNAWAAYDWQPVPCEIREHGGYAFDYQDKRYIATRRDFWDSELSPVTIVPRIVDIHPQDTCYVAPGDPKSAVLHLDTCRRWDLAVKPIFLTAFLICAAALITWKTRRPQPRRKN